MTGEGENGSRHAEVLKELGNTLFAKNKFGAAIDAYTEAISLYPMVAVYWTNRALCYRKRNQWEKVEDDCRKALQLDSGSVKAHYLLGLALLDKKEYSEGVKELERALNLGRGANPQSHIVEQIWQELANAKYLQWQDESAKRTKKLKTTRESCRNALLEQHMHRASQMEPEEATKSYFEEEDYLDEIFRKAAEADTPTQVPDHLCCKLTLDLFWDPVITPSGLTYERAALIHHLEKVGKFDPVTREQLHIHQLVPNLAIKHAVQAYLDDHGWAYKLS